MIFSDIRISLMVDQPPTLEEARTTDEDLLGYWWKPSPPKEIVLNDYVREVKFTHEIEP